MTAEEGHNEIVFQVTMNLAKKLLEQEVISDAEYTIFETEMKGKYNPIIGDIFSEIA